MPIILGIDVYESFLSVDAANTVVPMPAENETLLNGHAIILVGYSTIKQQFLAKNSFGTDWGDQGYCWIPFEYVKNYAFEKWAFQPSDQYLYTCYDGSTLTII